MSIEATGAEPQSVRRLGVAGVAALGVVFGDIGTSPLYTLKTVLDMTGPHPDPAATLGALSLILWTLLLITTVKYVNIAMRIDNDGEGGIIALMTLLGVKRHQRPLIIAVGLFGAALIYGDGAITPAISVLSALEGVEQIAPSLQTYVLPAATVILLALFAVQPFGTAKIGRAFGPIMLMWFAAIAALGVSGILQHPSVFAAVDPRYGLHYLLSGGSEGFLVLGGVFLCVTGAEALYADMGHFGPKPIRLSWGFIVFPALILNYAGQAAIVLAGAPTEGNIFYRLCPGPLLTPMIVLATIATVIASQSIITGAFSMTRQTMQLGWLPRMNITQTSEEGYGQIYVGAVNWLLMIVTLGLTIGFGKSDNLAAAYGIAVSATMLMTSVLLFIAMRECWNWPIWAAGAAAGLFVIIDSAFLAANLAKVIQGGWVPLLLASLVYGVMWIWHRGAVEVQHSVEAASPPLSSLLEKLHSGRGRAGARHGRVPHSRQGSDAAGHGLARASQPRAARICAGADLDGALSAMDRCRGAAGPRARRRQVLARGGAPRLHGASRHPGDPGGVQGKGGRGQPRRRHLLRWPRNRHPARERKGDGSLAGSLVRCDGAQRRADQRLSRLAERPGGRDRPRDRDLTRTRGGSSPALLRGGFLLALIRR